MKVRVGKNDKKIYVGNIAKDPIIGAWIRLLLVHPSQVRFLASWHSSRKLKGNALKDEVSWVTFKAKRWLESFLKPSMNVFEFSSGGSTLFMARRVKTLVAVEHDRKWYNLVGEALATHNIHNCQYLLKEPEALGKVVCRSNDPCGFVSSRYPELSFEKYVKSICAFPPQSFDFVSVDGRARPSCILYALDKVRPGGYLMLDNSDRAWYQSGKDLLADWKQTHFFGPGPYVKEFWQTSIYQKRN